MHLFSVGHSTRLTPVNISSGEIIIQFHRHLKTYLYKLAYPRLLPGESIPPLTKGLIETEIDQPCYLGRL